MAVPTDSEVWPGHLLSHGILVTKTTEAGAPLVSGLRTIGQLQPLVLPQPSQTKQLPAGRIFVPQVMQSGESTAVPVIFSKSSAEVWASPTPGLAGTSRASAPWVSLVSSSSVR